MVDWTILSPTYLVAVVEWAGALVTLRAAGLGRNRHRAAPRGGGEIPSHL
jgi:hypothetical protein